MTTALHTVHVRINDAGTGQPVPVRVRFSTADGHYYAPFGRQTEFATGRNQDVGGNVRLGLKAHAYLDGQCEINLPVGPVRVEVSHGPEYLPLDREVVIGPGSWRCAWNFSAGSTSASGAGTAATPALISSRHMRHCSKERRRT